MTAGLPSRAALKVGRPAVDTTNMRIRTHGERHAVPSVDESALDRIREWTDAAEMGASEESIRLLAQAARDATEFPSGTQ